jgi:hypothetical protein
MRGGWGGGGRVEGCGINAEELMGRDGRVSNRAGSRNIRSLSRIRLKKYSKRYLLWTGSTGRPTDGRRQGPR